MTDKNGVMDITEANISALIPYEFNNRAHGEEQVNRIANSIKEFGFNQPIVIDESNVVLVGHGRLLAAKKLGLSKVPVLKKTGLSEVQKKAYRILDNKLQNDSTWEFNNLELELGFLEDNGLNLEEWGLNEIFAKPTDEIEGLSDQDISSLESQFRIEITCMSELHQRELYERFKKEGLSCRLLSL